MRAASPEYDCGVCGINKRDHLSRWHASGGWHTWIQPTQNQIKHRMRQRRQQKLKFSLDGES